MNLQKYATIVLLLLLTVFGMGAGGCSSAYYGTMEKLGYHKRDILVSRVQEARDDQEKAKVQFADALEEFSAVTQFQGGDLEAIYKKLKAELAASETKAKAVSDRIASVEKVAAALFTEWEKELSQYTSAQLRAASEDQLRTTKRRYETLIDAMKRAESRMEPVLVVFRDQVLYLKHNLNARAIDALQKTHIQLESDVQNLISQMNASIKEADDFIKAMQPPTDAKN